MHKSWWYNEEKDDYTALAATLFVVGMWVVFFAAFALSSHP